MNALPPVNSAVNRAYPSTSSTPPMYYIYIYLQPTSHFVLRKADYFREFQMIVRFDVDWPR